MVQLYDSIKTIREIFIEWIDDEFNGVLNGARELCTQLEVPESLRPNERRIEADPVSFVKNQIFLPYLQNLVAELESRFDTGQIEIFHLQGLVPCKRNEMDMDRIVGVGFRINYLKKIKHLDRQKISCGHKGFGLNSA